MMAVYQVLIKLGQADSRGVALLLLLLSRFSHVRLCDPIDGSPPGSSIHGIFQARTLEWGAIALSVESLEHILIRLYHKVY